MPKNRHKNAASSTTRTPSTSGTTEAGPGVVRLLVASLALLVALGFAGLLCWEALGLGKLPGCGVDQGCGKATASVFGSIPLGEDATWSVAFLGFAYFVTAGVLFALHRRAVTFAFKTITTLGVLGSTFYLVVMALHWGDYFCPYCLTTHIANFVFAGAVLGAPISKAGPKTAHTVVAAFAGFLVTTGALAGVNAWAESVKEQQAEDQAKDSTSRILRDGDRSNPSTSDSGSGTTTTPAREEIAQDHPDLPLTAYRTDDQGFTGRYRLGPRESPIRIVMFSRYGCPGCMAVEGEVFDILKERDDVSFSHIHYPFEHECNPVASRFFKNNDCAAAYYSEAMGALYGPAAYWRYHETLYAQLRDKSFKGIEPLITGLGYDANAVKQAVDTNPEYKELVRADVRLAQSMGLMHTPTVYINGVEVRGWQVRGKLTQVVEEVGAKNLTPGSAEQDQPIDAIQKIVDDFYALNRPMRFIGQDANDTYIGEPDAPVDIQVFFGLGTEGTLETLRTIDELAARYPKAVRVTVRHYPMNEDCNFFSETMRATYSCEMHHALEASMQLGGLEAFRATYRWLLENGDEFEPGMLPELAENAGLDLAALEDAMASDEVQTAVFTDAQWLNDSAKLRAVYPIVYVNKRQVKKYEFKGDQSTILDRIIRRELGLDR